MAGHGSGSAVHLPGDLLARQAFKDPQFHDPPKCGVDGGEPVQNIVDFKQRMFCWGTRTRQVGELGFLRAPREWTGMMNQQPLHQVCCEPQERSLLIGSVGTGRPKGFDFDQFEVELVHQSSGLESVIRALGSHARGGDPSEFGVENLNQPSSGLMVAVAKTRHQPGYGIGLKTAWDRHFGTHNRQKKNSKATIQSAALLAHYGVSSLEVRDGSLTERRHT